MWQGPFRKESRVEVEAIRHVRHKNQVRRLGYCVEGSHRICFISIQMCLRRKVGNITQRDRAPKEVFQISKARYQAPLIYSAFVKYLSYSYIYVAALNLRDFLKYVSYHCIYQPQLSMYCVIMHMISFQ